MNRHVDAKVESDVRSCLIGRSTRPSLTAMSETKPIAIVAVSCRFPGAPDPEAFWEVLNEGVDAIREVPEDRFDIDEFYDPDPDTPGKTYTRFGGFLDGIDGFDPEFFGISPREAVWIEPQQRLILETVWEGLERAGYAPSALRGSRSGVFVGVAANEYAHLLSAEPIDKIEPYFITGNALNAISGRVAFALGFEGPAVAVDTACSSSLVAVHQACQALKSGDCDLAVAGGVNVLLSPVTVIAASRARMLSPVGRCKTFDASADGYVRSEGCGILVLNDDHEILLCHVTGTWHWDIPKGQAEPGETPLAAALRETREECGLDFSAQPLLDLGRMAYRPRKDLHLFAVHRTRFDAAATCRCSSHFDDPWGRSRPEMDGFEWTPFDRVTRRCAHRMGGVLTQTLSLPALLARLQDQLQGRPQDQPQAQTPGPS